MRLSSLVPTISSNLVAALETRGIRTEADLLYKASAFEIYKLLPAETVTLQELIDCIEIVAEVSAASGFSGTQLYRAEEATRSKDVDFRSGHVDLDSFLKGLNGQVIEISGDRSSGKSVRLPACRPFSFNDFCFHSDSCIKPRLAFHRVF